MVRGGSKNFLCDAKPIFRGSRLVSAALRRGGGYKQFLQRENKVSSVLASPTSPFQANYFSCFCAREHVHIFSLFSLEWEQAK